MRKVAVIVVTGLAVSFVLFGFLAREGVKESTQAVFKERLMMAQITANHIDFQLQEALEYLQSAPRTRGLDLYDGNPSPERVLLADVRSHLPVFAQQAYIADRNGTVLVADSVSSGLEGTNIFDYVHIRRVLESGKAEISGAILDPITRKPTVALAVPLSDETGRAAGVLGVSVDISRANLANLILDLKPGRTGHTQVLDGNGTVMASTETGFILRRSHHYDLLFSLIRQKAAVVVSHPTEDGEEQVQEVVAFAPLAHASWGVAVEQDEAEALAVGHELEVRLIVLGLLSLFGALATCAVVLRQVLAPIGHLTEATERIACGDLGGPPLTAGGDEVGRLAASFEVMRTSLKQSKDELDRWHKDLETRVQQRTAELSCLFELSKTIASSSDLDDMLKSAVRRIVEILDTADAAYIYLSDQERGRLVLTAWHGGFPEGLGPLYLALASRTFAARSPLSCAGGESIDIAESTQSDSLPSMSRPEGSRRDIGLITCAPLLTRDRVHGALLLHGPGIPEDRCLPDLPLVQALADQVAVAIQRAELAREAEQAAALRDADRLKSQFISTVTHELKTPLGFIKGYATTLLRPNASFDPETQIEFLQIISEESDSLSALIDDMLDISSIEAGAFSVEVEPVHVGKLARRAVDRVKRRASEHQFRLSISSRLPTVEADPRRVEQVIHNLLDNAIKYSPKGGQITVSARRRGDSVEVSIADQGIGIPEEEQPRVFDRFYRVAGSSALGRGAGLGLGICRGIVEAHRGTIRLESQPGKGTVVSFSLPVYQEALVEVVGV